MQSISVYLYQNKIDVYTNASAAWLTERYRRVYNRNLKIYRGVDNRIDIQVRNSDEKAASVVGSTLVFNLVERESQKLVVQKDCVTVSESTGRVSILLSEDELYDVEPGFYQYSLVREVRTSDSFTGTYQVTSRTPLYIDSQYGTLAVVEVLGSVTGEVQDSTVIREFSLHKSFGEQFDDYYISSIIDARPEVTTPQTLHTFQFNCTEYSGTVIIQGSITEGGNPHVWVDVDTQFIDNENIFYRNVVGKYNWFRIKHIPDSSTSLAEFTISQTLLGSYLVNIRNAGQGYEVGDIVNIDGGRLGGESGTNDLTITVVAVSETGAITDINWTGVSYNGVKTFVLSGSLNQSGTIDKILYR